MYYEECSVDVRFDLSAQVKVKSKLTLLNYMYAIIWVIYDNLYEESNGHDYIVFELGVGAIEIYFLLLKLHYVRFDLGPRGKFKSNVVSFESHIWGLIGIKNVLITKKKHPMKSHITM